MYNSPCTMRRGPLEVLWWNEWVSYAMSTGGAEEKPEQIVSQLVDLRKRMCVHRLKVSARCVAATRVDERERESSDMGVGE